MNQFLQAVLAVFAAVGFYSVLRVGYELLFCRATGKHGTAELLLYGKGGSRSSMRVVRAALAVRHALLPGVSIVFVEQGAAEEENAVSRMAEACHFLYLH